MQEDVTSCLYLCKKVWPLCICVRKCDLFVFVYTQLLCANGCWSLNLKLLQFRCLDPYLLTVCNTVASWECKLGLNFQWSTCTSKTLKRIDWHCFMLCTCFRFTLWNCLFVLARLGTITLAVLTFWWVHRSSTSTFQPFHYQVSSLISIKSSSMIHSNFCLERITLWIGRPYNNNKLWNYTKEYHECVCAFFNKTIGSSVIFIASLFM